MTTRLLLLLAPLALVACRHDRYVVELTPVAGGVQRTVTYHTVHEDGTSPRDLPEEDLALDWLGGELAGDARGLAGDEASTDDGYRMLQRAVTHRMGLDPDAPMPASLAFLGSQEALDASFERWSLTADPSLEEAVETGLEEVLTSLLFGPSLDVEFVLRDVCEPVLGNGTWDPTARTVRWEPAPIHWEQPLPRLVHATWVEPDAAWLAAREEPFDSSEEVFWAVLLAAD